jgi:hypothetical protein
MKLAYNPSVQQETASATSSKTLVQTSVPATKNNAPAQQSPAFWYEPNGHVFIPVHFFNRMTLSVSSKSKDIY